VVLIAGCLAIVGSFLPWIQVRAVFVGAISRNGLDGGGDGIVTIGLGILIGLLGIAILARRGSPRTPRLRPVVCGASLGYVAYTDISTVNQRIASVAPDVTASLGPGLILVALAAVLAVIGALIPASKSASG
jgi:hypothetical protein